MNKVQSATLGNDLYEKYTSRMRFEHDLINNRITWLLVSQGLLFSAYGSSFQNLRSVLPVLGILLSVLAAVGILASMAAKFCTWQDFKDKGHADEPFWVRTWITWLAATAEFLIPAAFAFAWITLLVTHAA